MAGCNVIESKAEHWITKVQGGVITLVQRIDADAFVVRAQDLPMLAVNEEIVTDPLAREILRAIGRRGRVRCGAVEVNWPLIEQG